MQSRNQGTAAARYRCTLSACWGHTRANPDNANKLQIVMLDARVIVSAGEAALRVKPAASLPHLHSQEQYVSSARRELHEKVTHYCLTL